VADWLFSDRNKPTKATTPQQQHQPQQQKTLATTQVKKSKMKTHPKKCIFLSKKKVSSTKSWRKENCKLTQPVKTCLPKRRKWRQIKLWVDLLKSKF